MYVFCTLSDGLSVLYTLTVMVSINCPPMPSSAPPCMSMLLTHVHAIPCFSIRGAMVFHMLSSVVYL